MDTPLVFTSIPFNFTREDVIEKKLLPFEDDDYFEALERAVAVARPRSITRPVEVEHSADGRVCAVGGQPMDSIVLDKNFGGLHRAFATVATCGAELDAFEDEGDILLRFALDKLRVAAATAARVYAMEKLRELFGVGKLSYVSPGSLPEWPITEQPKLFAMLGDVKGAIGVTLTESCLMQPMKSVSSLLFETEHDYHSCTLCKREGCIGRVAPYSPDESARLRGGSR